MICIANKNVLKYGIPRGVCGVYMIKNKITNDFYIGSSVDIEGRLSTHFGRDARHYINHPLYQAINNYDFEDFEFIDALCNTSGYIKLFSAGLTIL